MDYPVILLDCTSKDELFVKIINKNKKTSRNTVFLWF